MNDREPELWMAIRRPSESPWRWMVWTGMGHERWFEDEDEAIAAHNEAHELWRSRRPNLAPAAAGGRR